MISVSIPKTVGCPMTGGNASTLLYFVVMTSFVLGAYTSSDVAHGVVGRKPRVELSIVLLASELPM